MQPSGWRSRGAGSVARAGCADVGNRFLMQQQLRGLHARITMEPPLHNAIVEEVGNREQAHALVMSHPATHQFVAMMLGMMAGSGEVRGFVKSIRTQTSVATHSVQILHGIRSTNVQR